VGKEDIKIDDRPMEEMTVISIPLTETDYYYKHNLFGSRDRISRIGSGMADGRVIFEIHTEGICVMTAQIEKRCMYIRYDRPRDVYERIILIDPGHGGEDSGSVAYDISEKDIVSGIAEKISVSGDASTGVFFTRTGDEMVSSKEREEIAKKLDPDLLVTLHTNADDSTRITRGVEIFYNDPELKERSEKLADGLARILGSPEKTVMRKKTIPGYESTGVPCIYAGTGFITNRSEAELMETDDYGEKAAKALEEIF
ncbi:MAG: N-acetylmuramoyl-L-alanine amidase, partial [Lachnospiraceae bacterium]|nr:N-acetylmuramoyl-L-alanine amidase [Lachnospiraceae bacterium]